MIAIITAMGKEFALVRDSLNNIKKIDKNVVQGTLGQSKKCLVINSGIGKVNAAIAAMTALAYFGVEKVISIGCAAAVNTSLSVGDVVVGNSYCYHDVWCGEPYENGQVQGLPKIFPSAFSEYVDKDFIFGTIASGDWYVTDKERMSSIIRYLPKEYNICAVDMESAAIAQVCYKHNKPFVSMRIISDNPLLPSQEMQYEEFWNKMARTLFNALMESL